MISILRLYLIQIAEFDLQQVAAQVLQFSFPWCAARC